MSEIFKVHVPASTANLGPGFDTLSLALDLYNEFTFKVTKDGLKINQPKSSKLPEDSTNLVYKSFCEAFKFMKKTPPGIEVDISCNIPLSAGLGSSASAVVSGLFAANYLLNNEISRSDLLSLATKIEGHPDNCAAAIYGGLTISVTSDDKVYVNQFPWPNELLVVVITPGFELPTRISRELLPANLTYNDATFNVSRTAYLLSGLLKSDFENLKIGFQDRLHQPFRKELIPGMEDIFNTALKNGAYGATLSGAGPTLVAFTQKEKADQIGKAMQEKWLEHQVKSTYRILNIATEGAKVESLITN